VRAREFMNSREEMKTLCPGGVQNAFQAVAGGVRMPRSLCK
jgi:hypothetical protein